MTKLPAREESITIDRGCRPHGTRRIPSCNYMLLPTPTPRSAYIDDVFPRRDARRRKRERKIAEDAANGLATVNAVPNYGSCQRKPSKNGAVLKQTADEKDTVHTNYHEIDENIENYHKDEPHVLTERQARFMFMCDPSQLPREPTFDSTTALDSESAPTPKSSAPQDAKKIPEENPTKTETTTLLQEPHSQELQPSPPSEHEVPALVLVPSFSLESPITSDDSPTAQVGTVYLGNEPDSPTSDRPKSRRGSRVGDEVLDLREVGAPPENEHNNNFGQRPQEIVVDVNEKAQREHDLGRWSSSEGEVDVYYKLSDDEDMVRGDDWTNVKSTTMPASNTRQTDSDSDADDDDDEDDKLKHDSEVDGYVYERLREELTPVPPDS
ncbi:hypothetical protein Y032_0019g3824 [Ancylostoma ceylanicum]|uniref:Uncharacterized protein n=1 Tax=Ancylostoma ceylanicum TaxID=53326 RepID=A0A016V3Y5_9BILA|nr:hypothetical protein Y032_0019g3824 [Ancylostoma ceylanicum]